MKNSESGTTAKKISLGSFTRGAIFLLACWGLAAVAFGSLIGLCSLLLSWLPLGLTGDAPLIMSVGIVSCTFVSAAFYFCFTVLAETVRIHHLGTVSDVQDSPDAHDELEDSLQRELANQLAHFGRFSLCHELEVHDFYDEDEVEPAVFMKRLPSRSNRKRKAKRKSH